MSKPGNIGDASCHQYAPRSRSGLPKRIGLVTSLGSNWLPKRSRLVIGTESNFADFAFSSASNFADFAFSGETEGGHVEDSNAMKVQQAVQLKVRASPEASAVKVAEAVVSADPELALKWAVERITLIARAEQRAEAARNRPPDPYQMFFEGFKDLSERLPLKGGGTVPLAVATITDLRKNLKSMRSRTETRAQRTIRLIEEMLPFAKVQRGLTVQRYCELRAAGVDVRTFRAEVKKGAKKKA